MLIYDGAISLRRTPSALSTSKYVPELFQYNYAFIYNS